MNPLREEKRPQESMWAHRPIWDPCERRLALSAMPWIPWDVGPQDWQNPTASSFLPVNEVHVEPPLTSLDSVATPALQPHLSEAHSQTGWNQVHSQWGLTGSGQTVAVIDSGIAFDHVALGKGYGPGYRVVGGWDFAENDARPYDDAPAGFHGTHVSGIIGANDGIHFGVAPNVDLVALRVFTDAGKGELAWTENALKWVHENRNSFANPITTVNLSLGSAWNSSTVPSWGSLEDELAQLQRDGIVVVASAGNSFQQFKAPGLSYPAASPFVIPVSSIDANGQISDFSQRDSRAIAAPGRAIESTVPDYFYGKDGVANDWSTASGTSMAAPYISGASVLVREAMELVGVQNITAQSVYEHLRNTANSVWDSITKQNYQVLDLDRAIESLLPIDNVGDTLGTGQVTSVQNSWQTDGWLNSLSDRDVYRLLPTQSGTVSVQFDSESVDDAFFSLLRGGQETTINATDGRLSFSVLAGESLGLSIADSDSIGSFHLNWNFSATAAGGGGGTLPAIPSNVVDLGSIDLFEQSLSGSSRYKLTAEHTGILSVVVDAGTQPSGSLQILRPLMSSGTLADASVEASQWRIDLNVIEGQSIEFVLPGAVVRNVHVVNLVQRLENAVTIYGTDALDNFSLDLSKGIIANVGGIDYSLDSNLIKSIILDGQQNNDSLTIVGSSLAEKVELRPGIATLESTQLSVRATSFENVRFVGGGGPDRAYLYDAATDDRLNIWPNKAELTGVGYAFGVETVDRIFVNAVQGGDDQAFVFDSVGDDSLSVRPQFTSLSGSNFFNYISGFERVFAYASSGGTDNAVLYDSVGNDLFSTSSEVTSIVGPGFSTFARGFENVEAFSTAGGFDRANVYAPANGKLTAGADFVGMQDSTHSSVARSFEKIDTFVAGFAVPLSAQVASLAISSDDPFATVSQSDAAPHGASQDLHVSSDRTLFDGLEKINSWVEKEIRSLRSERWSFASPIPFLHGDESDGDLDLAWVDHSTERAVLDEIFSRQS